MQHGVEIEPLKLLRRQGDRGRDLGQTMHASDFMVRSLGIVVVNSRIHLAGRKTVSKRSFSRETVCWSDFKNERDNFLLFVLSFSATTSPMNTQVFIQQSALSITSSQQQYPNSFRDKPYTNSITVSEALSA